MSDFAYFLSTRRLSVCLMLCVLLSLALSNCKFIQIDFVVKRVAALHHYFSWPINVVCLFADYM